MTSQTKKLVGVLSDLMFTVKIQDAAKRAGIESVFVKSAEAALRQADDHPALMILDLNDAAAHPLDLIAKLKASERHKQIPLIGFVSHVQIDLRREAEQRGCDKVVARSVFSQNLPEILKEYAGS